MGQAQVKAVLKVLVTGARTISACFLAGLRLVVKGDDLRGGSLANTRRKGSRPLAQPRSFSNWRVEPRTPAEKVAGDQAKPPAFKQALELSGSRKIASSGLMQDEEKKKGEKIAACKKKKGGRHKPLARRPEETT